MLWVRKLLDFSKINYFFTVCAFAMFFQYFLIGSKRQFFLACITIDFLPFPQPVQRMSYFRGQDGGRSQVTSFYRSTPQTSMLPSHARQKAVLLHSTGTTSKLYSPWASPHCLPALTILHGENPLLLNCLWIFSAASTAIKSDYR